jgi:hypothetical protein
VGEDRKTVRSLPATLWSVTCGSYHVAGGLLERKHGHAFAKAHLEQLLHLLGKRRQRVLLALLLLLALGTLGLLLLLVLLLVVLLGRLVLALVLLGALLLLGHRNHTELIVASVAVVFDLESASE